MSLPIFTSTRGVNFTMLWRGGGFERFPHVIDMWDDMTPAQRELAERASDPDYTRHPLPTKARNRYRSPVMQVVKSYE